MRLIFVTPWYGPAVPGGAEALTRHTAEALQQAGLPVEVWTTCIRDLYADWATNFHQPGTEQVGNVTVRRFAVGKRDRAAFDGVNARLMRGEQVNASEARTFIEEMFHVPALYEAIAAADDAFFFFIPYLFATTYFGAQIQPERSAIILCLHDEAYTHLDLYQEVIPAVRGLLFNTEAEQRLAHRLFGRQPHQVEAVVGMGVGTEVPADPEQVAAAFRRKYRIEGSFLLYAGRREVGKNTPLLLSYWQRYLRESGRPVQLVLIGPNEIPLPARDGGVLDLGYLPAEDKWGAYAAATALCQPSTHESFSIVILESWLMGRPVLVHGNCAVTREHSLKANGGLYFVSYEEFAAALDLYFEQPALAQQLGRQGQRYVQSHFQWEQIVAQYRQLLTAMQGESSDTVAGMPDGEDGKSE